MFLFYKYCVYICSMKSKEIAKKLSDKRIELGITYHELSLKTGINLTHLHRTLEGKHKTNVEAISTIADAFGLELILKDKLSYSLTAEQIGHIS